MLAKLLEKKKKEGKTLSPMQSEAKISMLQALKDEMGDGMKDELMGNKMNKVSVAAPDEQGLKEGLDKAQDLLGGETEEASGEEETEAAMSKYQLDPSKENLEALMACLEKKKSEMGTEPLMGD